MKCSECSRTETARWYGKKTPTPICCSCYRKDYVAKNRDKALAAQRKANGSVKSIAARKAYGLTEVGRESKNRYDRNAYQADPEKYKARNNTDEHRAMVRDHYQRNKAYYTEKSIRRARNIDKASLGGVHREETINIYKTCPEGYEVDHIVPLKGYDYIDGKRQHVVCGLHTPWNLQHLTKAENRSKSCNLY